MPADAPFHFPDPALPLNWPFAYAPLIETRTMPSRPMLPETSAPAPEICTLSGEGMTLVVETANFSPGSTFIGSAEHLHLVERFTRVAADTINYEVTLDDPTTWTRSWTVAIPLKQTQANIYEFACHEGNRDIMRGILAGARAEEKAEEAAR